MLRRDITKDEIIKMVKRFKVVDDADLSKPPSCTLGDLWSLRKVQEVADELGFELKIEYLPNKRKFQEIRIWRIR